MEQDDVRLEAHGGGLHLVVYGKFICDFAEFKRTEWPIGELADFAVENLREALQPKK